MELLRKHPDLPPWRQINSWQAGKAWFRDGWRKAHQQQAHFLAQKCIELANSADPKTAHVIRVKFDILKWYAAKMHPDFYGDKPQQAPTTNVQIGLAISPERLTEIRTKLDNTRSAFITNGNAPAKPEPDNP